MFRRAERSLFAQGHVEMISFFFRVRDIPPRFNSLDLIFLDTYWSDLSDFCINTQTVSQSIIFQIFGGQIFFRQVSENSSILGFSYWANAVFLSPLFTLSLEMLIFVH